MLRNGLVVFASDVKTMSEFYRYVLGFSVSTVDELFTTLISGEFELVLLETEVAKAANDQRVGVDERASVPIKPVYFLECSFKLLTERITTRGGHVRPPKNWLFGGRIVCDCTDPEGNIFQVRLPS